MKKREGEKGGIAREKNYAVALSYTAAVPSNVVKALLNNCQVINNITLIVIIIITKMQCNNF